MYSICSFVRRSAALCLRTSSPAQVQTLPPPPAKPKETKPMGPFWRFFQFADTELEKQFWDSSSQRSRYWLAGLFFCIFGNAVFQTVQFHLRGDPVINLVPIISSCAISLLLTVLNALPHRWHQHMMYVNAISFSVLGALMLWFLHLNMFRQISESTNVTIAGTTPLCSDSEIVHVLRQRLKEQIVEYHITLSFLVGCIALTLACLCINWCKTSILTSMTSFIIFIVWRFSGLFVPSELDTWDVCANPAFLIMAAVLPFAVGMAVTDERRKVFLANFLREQDRAYTREADSILNHTLKNTMADAAGQLEIFLDDPNLTEDLDARLIQNLKMALASLQRGMKCCRNRQAYLSLVSGTYTSVRSALKMHQFLSDVTMGRAVAVETQLDVEDDVRLDPILMDLILDNAIANATKYGHPRGPNVRITVKDGPNESTVFQVTNVANPDSKALTAEYVESMFSGVGRHKHHSSNDPLSSGIGLQHTQRAALACGTDISLRQEGDLVIFQAVVQTSSGPPPSVDQDDEEDEVDSAFPNGLHFCYIDDSKFALRTLELGLQRHAGAAKVETFGQNGQDDVPQFMAQAPKADVIIFDRHIDFPGKHVSGLELLRKIKAAGFRGLLVIRSGNTSDQDRLEYREAGCHCVLGKDLLISEASNLIKKAYLRQQRCRAPPAQAQSSSPNASDTVVEFRSLCSPNLDPRAGPSCNQETPPPPPPLSSERPCPANGKTARVPVQQARPYSEDIPVWEAVWSQATTGGRTDVHYQ